MSMDPMRLAVVALHLWILDQILLTLNRGTSATEHSVLSAAMIDYALVKSAIVVYKPRMTNSR